MQTTSLFIESSILTRLAIEVDRVECALHTPLATDDKIIKFAIQALLEEYARSKRIPQIILSTVGHYVATHLLLKYAKTGVSSTVTSRMPEWQLRRALDYIEAHLGRDIGLDDLAAVAGMTPHYFCRAFRLSTGVPPYRYLLNRRIERAKELLRLTSQSVTEIALDVGFISPAHFSSAFRSAAGSTPSAYRRAAGEAATH